MIGTKWQNTELAQLKCDMTQFTWNWQKLDTFPTNIVTFLHIWNFLPMLLNQGQNIIVTVFILSCHVRNSTKLFFFFKVEKHRVLEWPDLDTTTYLSRKYFPSYWKIINLISMSASYEPWHDRRLLKSSEKDSVTWKQCNNTFIIVIKKQNTD